MNVFSMKKAVQHVPSFKVYLAVHPDGDNFSHCFGLKPLDFTANFIVADLQVCRHDGLFASSNVPLTWWIATSRHEE